MKFIIILFLALAACDDKATSGGTPVHRGDPTRHTPTKKEKAGTIVQKFNALHITVDCPSCSADYDDSLQSLYNSYSDFQMRRGRITQITLGDSDVVFDAKNRFLMMPKVLDDKTVRDFFLVQKGVENYEGLTRLHLSFPKDPLKTNVIQKTLAVVGTNKIKLHTLTTKIDWIDFDGTHAGCADRTWSVSRDDFENHFDQVFNALKCP